MKLGDVLKKERENREIPAQEAATKLGVSLADYESIENGADQSFEQAGQLLVKFNEMIRGQANQLFYPCGLPFMEVEDYQRTP